jgi:hypothetical protein
MTRVALLALIAVGMLTSILLEAELNELYRAIGILEHLVSALEVVVGGVA